MFNLSNSFAFRRETAQAKLLEIIEWGFSEDSYKRRPFQVHSLLDCTLSSNRVSGPLWYLKDKSFGRSDDFPVDTKVVRPNGDVASLEYVQVGSRRFEKVWEDAVFHVDRRK
ncbi:hypothetical protein GAYE_SCF01G1924 [Galdieria yellowstonensis]|jgi:hypothetical protein|uniref:Uncharacterized protein n=1 Tax=Galdieria yellowstonensis TaxID=3028027 RepID=A0AAV9I9B6_9RHOD|nr:hypothetical protein GAYE_SCF01G1924 [Galdieria yellowstonensis]